MPSTRLLPVAALGSLLLAACGDVTIAPPVIAPPDGPAAAILECRARVAALTVSCAPQLPPGVTAARLLGGQNTNLRLASRNVRYAAGVFAFDMTVENLLVQKMGTADGTTVDGIRVFFHSGPTATGGSGEIEVLNATGTGTFTGAAQPFFRYPEILAYRDTSQALRWELGVPAGVESFGFTLYLYTELLPVVIFDASVGGNRDIYRVAVDGSDLVRLTTHTATEENPTVSQRTVVYTSYRNGNADLYSIPITGGAETRLTTSTLNETDAAISTDGTRLAYTRELGGLTRLYTADLATPTTATLLNAGSGVIEASAQWSPGDTLVYMSTAAGNADLWRNTVGGTQALVAGTSNSAEVEPAWSHDGARIAFASDSLGDTELFVKDMATNTTTRVTNRVGSDGSPSWLRDGRIVYTCTTATTPLARRLCILDPDTPAYQEIPVTGLEPRRPWAVPF